MQIHIDTSEPLSDTDKQVLAVLTGKEATTPAAKVNTVAAKPAAKPAPEKDVEPDPEPEPDADADAGDGVSLEDARALASKMVSNGEAAKVKAALTSVGAKKISEVDDDSVQAFYDALNG